MSIPAITVDANIQPLDVHEGVLEGPARYSDAGWWQAGPEPGEAGAAVIAGHIDSHNGPAAFFRLRELRPGDAIVVTRSDGTTMSFQVTHLERFRKGGIPASRVFGETTEPALRLITCGGEYDDSRRTYRDNVVAYAAASG